MTVTTEYLSGTPELFSDTIRTLLYTEWAPDDIPKIFSLHGGEDAVGNELTENDFIAARKGEDSNLIRVWDGNTAVVNASNTFVELESTVYIDVFGQKSKLLEMVNEVDRILFETQPNNTKRINKSDARASAIWNIKEYVPNWNRIAADREDALPEQYAGEITILWQKTKRS